MIRRRTLLATAAAALATPAIAQPARLLKFVPHADLTIVDPYWTTAYITRNHAMMVYDTLYGTDAAFNVTPQMAEGHRIEDDGKTIIITLREGLKFHDNTPVLARDCVASIQRWTLRDNFGQTVAAVIDELRNRRPLIPLPPQTPLPPAHRRPRQARLQRLRHHARTPHHR